MILKKIIKITFFLCCAWQIQAQHELNIDATLNSEKDTFIIEQEVVYKNTSEETLTEIYFFDWANSFSTKTTPLAKRFAENYDSSFHFEKEKDRGRTNLNSISDNSKTPLKWERGDAVDILKVIPSKAIESGESYTFSFSYSVKVPDDKFTRYGVDKDKNYHLRYWYISPAVYDGSWQIYSNKNVDDLYAAPSLFNITLNTPEKYNITSDFNVVSENTSNNVKTTVLKGEDRINAVLYLDQIAKFEGVETDKFTFITDIKNDNVNSPVQALTADRIIHFLDKNLGDYPFDKMVVSEIDYKKSPVYGLNLLPSFISPFPDGFEYDMELLKSITHNYIENTITLNSRKDVWLEGALQIYLMMEYVDTYYPKMKIIGSLSNWWVIRWAHVADLEFNEQYPVLYLNMARSNLHQPLTTPQDSLLKFNKNIANDYYGGVGLKYLEDYIGKDVLAKSIKDFYAEKKLTNVKSSDFEAVLSRNTELPVNWFFEDFAGTKTTIDFKIKKVEKKGDSLKVTIKNKRDNTLPVSLYGIKKDSILFKTWLSPIDSVATIKVPAKGVKKLVLNYEGKIPEYNRRNNYKSVSGLFNRPFQFRLFQDIEDPNYNQLFFMPIFEYNLYDGVSAGVKLYNKTFLPKAVYWRLEPQFGFRSKTLVGSGAISYTQQFNEDKLYAIRYGLSGNYYSYDEDLFYRRFVPYMTFAFRNKDLRDNEKQYINVRNITVNQDEDITDPDQEPNYSVFNLQYVYSNPNLINYFRGSVDFELSSKFSKLYANFEYRKLFLNNRQLNVRLFAGTFLYNDTSADEDFFSFALDRPTDYLFDYNYYGRSEDRGLFSQQLIIAEGGFKSQLEPAFANSWMVTANASTNIWKWIYAYGDVGVVHNSHIGTKAVFDSGIRLTLLADYFELYFPVYSSLGFEPNLPHYDEKVRFIVTISPQTLLGLFTRRWY